MRSHQPSPVLAAPSTPSRSRAKKTPDPKPFAFVGLLAAILTLVGLASCAGYTSPGGQSQSPGTGILSPSVASLSCGSVSVGSNSTQSLSITNTGTATVNIS